MKILVTGGAGYKGSILVPNLLALGHEVILFDNFTFGAKPILHFANDKKLEIVKGDVRDEKHMKEVISKVDVVMHLAAIVGYPACAADPGRAHSINVDGSRNVVNNLSKNQRAIFASTGSTYGKVDGICDENTPIAPLTLYGSTKAEAEKMFLDIGSVALRFATVFGISPRLRLDLLINDFVYQAIHAKQIVLFEGSFRRTFLHVIDAVNSYLFALENYEAMSGESFNVGDDSMNYTKKDVAIKIKEKLPFYLHEAEIGQDFDQRDYEVSYNKIKKLGFSADITLDGGIDELIKVLKNITVINEWRNA
ncbi:MAG: NAD-dependent epimerase/dehydratase family protein [Bacteroidales bacterium]|nr:NAD-dependent epimerase/dehydratase family protein [Bacteroidales bacterium]MCF8405818.1 NAD-dependent epimerase/dehydratase family protein [Bacteroidales bacterium]